VQWTWLLTSLGVVLAIYASFIAWLVIRGRREDAHAFATFIPDCIVLVTRLARDPRVPRRRKFLLIALVAYLGLPFDLVPDFIPVAGQLDDAIIVALVLRHFIRGGGEPMLSDLWPGPEQTLAVILRLARPVDLKGGFDSVSRNGGEGRVEGDSPSRPSRHLVTGAFAPFVRPTPRSDSWRHDRGRIVS
jgi:uncharacterized membrane protein YkvA (DUF1232 family)